MITINSTPQMDAEKTAKILAEIEADQMGGWLKLPQNFENDELTRIKQAAKQIQDESEVLVCIGIGGSYLGHRALIEALGNKSETEILYAGNSLSRRELERTMNEVGDRDFSVLVISKSGTTLEPRLAFSAFKEKLIEKYGEEGAAERIYATTDAEEGMLHDEAVENHYTRFVVPDDIGGRYSVLSPVGLLPLAVAGIKIDKLLEGAEEAMAEQAFNEDSAAVKYAWTRYAFGVNGYETEVFATFEPATAYFNEWLKQLFGESEGKQKQGIFPASVVYTTDLHSMGQFMQEGRRDIWETIINFPTDETNEKAVTAVHKAHAEGGIPVLQIEMPSYDEKGFGELIYFFELACAISAKLFGVNPFDQPGVEAYKKNLRALRDLDEVEDAETEELENTDEDVGEDAAYTES